MTDRARAGLRGVSWSAASTFVIGVLGLISIAVVARSFGPTAYAGFAALWAAFFGIGGVFAGLQAEVTRATSRPHTPGSRLVVLALLVAVPVSVVGAWVAVGLSPTSKSVAGASFALGLTALAALTLTSGLLVTDRHWGALAALMVFDAVVRTVALLFVALAATAQWLPVAIAAGPGSWLLLMAFPRWRSGVVAVSLPAIPFLRRAVVAMASSGCAAVVVSGLPFLVGLLKPGGEATTGALLAALVLIRSGLLMLTYGLRPVMLGHFLDVGPDSGRPRTLWVVVGAIGAGYVLVVTITGPLAIRVALGEGFVTSPLECGSMAIGAVGLMFLVINGMSLIADDRHWASAAGWVVSLVFTIALVVLPTFPADSVLLSSAVAPWTGVLVQFAHAVIGRRVRGRDGELVQAE